MNIRPFSGTSRTITENPTTRTEITNNTFLGRIFRKGSSSNNSNTIKTSEEVIDLDHNLENYNARQISLLNPRTLYHVGPLNLATSLLRINREEVLVTTGPVTIPIISNESLKELRKTRKRLVHIGLIVVAIKGLTRKELGCKTLLRILDKSWKGSSHKALIANIEVDMNRNTGLFFCSPDMLISIYDLHNLEIEIQTTGYEELDRKSDLLINIGFLGKATNSSTTNFKLNIEDIFMSIARRGIKMIKPMKTETEQLEGLDWIIDKNLEDLCSSLVLEQGKIFKNYNGTHSLRFSQSK